MIKVIAPGMAPQIVDWSIQVLGGGGTGNDHFVAAAFATTRLLRLADGPDEVHRSQIGKIELRRHRNTDPNRTGSVSQPLTLDEAAAWLTAASGRDRRISDVGPFFRGRTCDHAWPTGQWRGNAPASRRAFRMASKVDRLLATR